jgi:hypothetical protein
MCHERLCYLAECLQNQIQTFQNEFHTKKKNITSLQITRTILLIILYNTYNELHKMDSLQDRLLYYKKNNKKQLFGHYLCNNAFATIQFILISVIKYSQKNYLCTQ